MPPAPADPRIADPVLVGRVERLRAAVTEEFGAADPRLAAIDRALAGYDAPARVVVTGCAGSGAGELAATLGRLGVDDVTTRDPDAPVAGPPAQAEPDVEVFCLVTAPCAHETALLRRPRRHPIFAASTRRGDDAPPAWERGLTRVDPADPEHPATASLAEAVRAAADGRAGRRGARLVDELLAIAADPRLTDAVEAALLGAAAEEAP